MSKRLCFIAMIIVPVLFAAGCSSSGSKTTQPTAAVEITSPTTNPVIDQGQTVNVTAQTADGGAVTWSLVPAFGTPKITPIGALTNTTGTSATYTACAPGTGCQATQQVSIVATEGTNSATLPVIINSLPTVNAVSLFAQCPPAGQPPQGSIATVGKYFNTPLPNIISVSGGVAPYTWSVVSGALPNGLTLGPVSANSTMSQTVTGFASAPGCPSGGVTVQVTDATGVTASSMPLYFVAVPAPLSIKLPLYSNGIGGVSYNPTAIEVSGGQPPYTWCVATASSGSGLPIGLGAQTLPPTTSWTTSSNGNFLCTAPQPTPTLVISGSVSGANEYQSFSPTFTVSDSENPYPALGGAGLNMNPLPPTTCSSTAASSPVTYLQPGVPHVFQLRGFDANGPVLTQGSRTTPTPTSTRQRVIVGGEEDIIRTTGSQTGLSVVSGSYFNASDRGCMTLVNSAGTTTQFQFTLGGCSLGATVQDCFTLNQPSDSSSVCGQQTVNSITTYYLCLPVGKIIEFDNNDGTGTVATGILRTADPSMFSSGLSGLYAFGLRGWDSNGGRYAAAGSFNVSSGSLSSVAADINDAGTIQSSLTGGSGSFSSIDNNGRASVSLSAGNTSLNLVAYVVNSDEIVFSTTGTPSASTPTVSGEAIATSGPFSAASLQNAHMFRIGGLATAGADVSVGLLSFDGAGDVSGTVYEDQAGTPGTTPASANYVVNPATGRLNFTISQAGQTLGAHPFVAYIIPPSYGLTRASCVNPASCITGFLVGTTDSTAQAGVLEFQTPYTSPPPPFYNDYVAGYYTFGTDELLDSSPPAVEGYAYAKPSTSGSTSGTFSLNQDFSSANLNYCVYAGASETCNLLINSDLLNPGSSYTVSSNGSGAVDGESVMVTNGNVVFYISESPLNLHPSVMVAEQ